MNGLLQHDGQMDGLNKLYTGRLSVQRILTKYLTLYIEFQARKLHFNQTVFYSLIRDN